MTTTSVDTQTLDVKIPAEMPEFAAEQSFTSAMRVVRVEQAVKAWQIADQTFELAPGTSIPFEHAIVCMLSDLRFLCDQHGLDFARLDRRAYDDYVESLATERRKAERQKVTTVKNVPSESLKKRVLESAYVYDRVLPLDGYQYLAGRQARIDTGIFVVDGTMDRATYLKILEEAVAAGLNRNRVIVHGVIATYLGAGTSFSKFEDIPGLSPE